MAVPARRTSKMRKNTRRSHDALISRTTANCPNCGSVVLPHHACMKCHTYKGENIPTSKKTTALAKDDANTKAQETKADKKDKTKADIKETQK